MANPGSSFEGLQESIVNYGKNDIELITALHEESAVAAAHGYAKAEGRPMVALLHGTIGIQHAAMAIYNAYCDSVPILMIAGLDFDGPVAAHNATDMAALVRGYTKWDDQPRSSSKPTSIQRAYQIATTPPTAPVMVTLTETSKEETAGRNISVPIDPRIAPPVIATKRIAKALVDAQNPRINVGRLRTPRGVELAIELVDLLGAQAGSSANGGPMSFPMSHRLRGNGVIGVPVDFTLGLEAGAGGQRPPGEAGPSGAGASLSATIQGPALMAVNFNVGDRGVQPE
jgi:benzoylformate decarboxylase/acetolactate synthase-1/2/3 large subunit